MNRAEFIERLKMLLSDISESEREEALNYYEDYFNDAGAENEQQIIESLGSPEKVAQTIKDGLNDVKGENGEFSETGFSGYGDTVKDGVVQHGTQEKQKFSERIKGLGTGGLVILLILAIFALPVLGPVLTAVVSVAFALLVAAAVILFALVIVGVSLIVAGIAVIGASFGTLFLTPAVAVLLIGVGLLLTGIGILLTILGIWIVCKIIPPIIRGIVKMIRRPFERREA